MFDLDNIADSELHVISDEEAWEQENESSLYAQAYRNRKEQEHQQEVDKAAYL